MTTKFLKGATNFEIGISLGGKLPTGDFEILDPLYTIHATYPNSEIGRARSILKGMRDELGYHLDGDFDTAVMRRVEKARGDIRHKRKGNRIYIHVTSILDWMGIDYDPYLLAQYAARGKIVHKIWELYIRSLQRGKAGNIINPEKYKSLAEEVALVKNGSLGLKWEDCNIIGFWEKYGESFRLKGAKIEHPIYNDEYLYCGQVDFSGMHEGEFSVVEIKAAQNYGAEKLTRYWKQLSAYAKAEGAKRMVIIPLNPSNKQGYGAPMIECNVDKYFKMFVADRDRFRRCFKL